MHLDVDTRDFDNKLKEYVQYNTRTIPVIIATKLSFIGRHATKTTVATPPAKVRMDLLLPAKDAPRAPLAAVIVQKIQKKKGLPGWYGPEMAKAIDKLIKARERSVRFLRSGWIPGIKKLAALAEKRGQPQMDTGLKVRGIPKGGATVPLPRDNWVAEGELWNSIIGGKDATSTEKDKVGNILTKGLEEAIKREVASMDEYIQSKLKPAEDKFNQ